jgi:N-acetyltransferase
MMSVETSAQRMDLQPTMAGELLTLRPLREEDFDALLAVGSDPLIWELHPERERYRPDVFRTFFQGALDSGGAFIITDNADGRVIGSSRYFGYDPSAGEVEIGWTFLARSHWGGRYNAELKRLMIAHALDHLERVVFLVGPENWRSQRALEKIGAIRHGWRLDDEGKQSALFVIDREGFRKGPLAMSGT